MKQSFSEYDLPKNTGLSWDSTDRDNAVPEVSELNGFYREVFQPVWQLLNDMATNLMAEWFSGGLNALGQLGSWLDAKKHAKAAQAHKEHLKKNFKQAKSLTLESTLALHKINNDLGKRGNTTLSKTDEQNNQPIVITNPWLDAVKKQRCTLPVLQTKPNKPSRPQLRSKKTSTEEPNRGLDDIYTSPVSALFLEDKELATLKKPATHWRKPVAPTINTQVIAAMIDAELERTPQKPKRMAPQQASKPIVPDHRPASTAPQQNAPPNTVPSQFDAIGSFNETFEQLQAALYSGAPTKYGVQGVSSGVNYAEPQESEFIPGFTLADEEPIENLTTKGQLGAPEQVGASVSQQIQATETISTNGSGSLLHAKAKAAHMDFKRQMPVYQEMKIEMSGADHMVRNNRILHNSISNLTESYFKKAAAEDAQNS